METETILKNGASPKSQMSREMNDIQKKIRLFVKGMIYILLAVFMTGCGTANLGVYDRSTPSDEQCTLFFDTSISFAEFDGKAVNWDKAYRKTVKIIIPAGNHTFSGSAIMSAYMSRNFSLTYTFEAGKTYKMDSKRGYVAIQKQ